MPLLQNLATNEIVPMGTDDDGGLPLGITVDIPYDMQRASIPNNSRVLLYTDGVAEAFPEGKEVGHDEFGTDGIIRTLQETAELPVDQALDRLFTASHDFTQGAGRHDDTSMVLLEHKSD